MRVRRVNVGPTHVEAIVEFEPHEPLRTSEVRNAEERALGILPGLKGHRCDNEGRHPFAHELKDTELAHVIEHAALEIMAMAGSSPTLRGSTAWDFAADGHGVFRLSLEYDNDLVAIGAISVATEVVRWIAEGGTSPDPESEARRLAGMRGR